jgi:hypothetical protein
MAKLDTPRVGSHELWSLDVELRVRNGSEVLEEFLERICSTLSQ